MTLGAMAGITGTVTGTGAGAGPGTGAGMTLGTTADGIVHIITLRNAGTAEAGTTGHITHRPEGITPEEAASMTEAT